MDLVFGIFTTDISIVPMERVLIFLLGHDWSSTSLFDDTTTEWIDDEVLRSENNVSSD